MASQISPQLLLGDIEFAENLDALLASCVTHVVCAAFGEGSPTLLQPYFPGRFTYHMVALWDEENEDLLKILPAAVDFIISALESGGRW